VPDPEVDGGDAARDSGSPVVDDEDQERLRSSLGFAPVSPARQNLLSEMREVASARSTRRRANRDAAVPPEAAGVVDDVGVRFDELRSAIEAIAARIGRGGRGESVPIMEQLRRLTASQSVLREDIQRLVGMPLSGADRAPGTGGPASTRAERRLDATDGPASTLAALLDRVAAIEQRMNDRNDLVETQLEVIGGQLAGLQAGVSGAFAAADVDQLRTRLERLSAEVSGLRSELRSSWDSPAS
jgi:hypothetical protein